MANFTLDSLYYRPTCAPIRDDPSRVSDHQGELLYVVAVLCIYSFSIFLMIGSLAVKTDHDQEVTQYTQEREKIRAKGVDKMKREHILDILKKHQINKGSVKLSLKKKKGTSLKMKVLSASNASNEARNEESILEGLQDRQQDECAYEPTRSSTRANSLTSDLSRCESLAYDLSSCGQWEDSSECSIDLINNLYDDTVSSVPDSEYFCMSAEETTPMIQETAFTIGEKRSMIHETTPIILVTTPPINTDLVTASEPLLRLPTERSSHRTPSPVSSCSMTSFGNLDVLLEEDEV